jgi:predicted transcriptional regulator
MASKKPPNHGMSWTSAADGQLRKLARQNTPTRLIANELGRTEAAVRSHASDIDVSLKPTNQSPYNRRKQ